MPQKQNRKITLIADDLWVIRSIRTFLDKTKKVCYYESPSIWNRAPTKSTIFTSFEIAEIHMRLLRDRDLKGTKNYSDGSIEEFDVVPLYSEITHGYNGKTINLK